MYIYGSLCSQQKLTEHCISTIIKKKDVVHIHNGILLSHKMNEIMPFGATWMQPEITILNEVSQK